jgi:hypothetical protein
VNVQSTPEEILRQLYAIFGQVVLLPIPVRSKKPVAGWNSVTFEETQTPAYQAELLTAVRRCGNIGCRAGGGLVFVDFDNMELAKVYADASRGWETLQVYGKRGCQFVYRMKPGTWYPNTQAIYALKGPDGKPCGEWRCGGGDKGAQSVVYGIHPENVEYSISLNDIQTIDFAELKWPWGPFWKQETAGATEPEDTEPKPKKKRKGDSQLDDDEVAQQLEQKAYEISRSVDAYYDQHRKEYILRRDGTSAYQCLAEAQFKRELRFLGLSAAFIPRRNWTQLDIALRVIMQEKFVSYVGPLAGKASGYYYENGTPLLVTVSPTVIEPSRGHWPTINEFFSNLLWDPDEPWGDQQQIAFYGWLKVSYNALRTRKFQPGQALAIAGEPDAGKSLTQKLVTTILGGRCAKAALFLQGRTDFNSDLFGAEHLMLEDESASTSRAARLALAAQIKSIVSNQTQPCHGKHRDIVNLSPWWRVTISLNDRPDRMLVLPPLDDDLSGKIILLRATVHEMPMPADTPEQKESFWQQLLSELPAFLYWLLTEFEIPQDHRVARFGVRAFHHPVLTTELEELSPAMALLGLIDQADFWIFGADKKVKTWKGTALELRALLMEFDKTKRDAIRLLDWTNACGQYLNDLVKIRPKRVTNIRTHDVRGFEITRAAKADL